MRTILSLNFKSIYKEINVIRACFEDTSSISQEVQQYIDRAKSLFVKLSIFTTKWIPRNINVSVHALVKWVLTSRANGTFNCTSLPQQVTLYLDKLMDGYFEKKKQVKEWGKNK